jgi:hypothetical protein
VNCVGIRLGRQRENAINVNEISRYPSRDSNLVSPEYKSAPTSEYLVAVRFEVSTAVRVTMLCVWAVTPCRLVPPFRMYMVLASQPTRRRHFGWLMSRMSRLIVVFEVTGSFESCMNARGITGHIERTNKVASSLACLLTSAWSRTLLAAFPSYSGVVLASIQTTAWRPQSAAVTTRRAGLPDQGRFPVFKTGYVPWA